VDLDDPVPIAVPIAVPAASPSDEWGSYKMSSSSGKKKKKAKKTVAAEWVEETPTNPAESW
jgi:hypothetical protein